MEEVCLDEVHHLFYQRTLGVEKEIESNPRGVSFEVPFSNPHGEINLLLWSSFYSLVHSLCFFPAFGVCPQSHSPNVDLVHLELGWPYGVFLTHLVVSLNSGTSCSFDSTNRRSRRGSNKFSTRPSPLRGIERGVRSLRRNTSLCILESNTRPWQTSTGVPTWLPYTHLVDMVGDVEEGRGTGGVSSYLDEEEVDVVRVAPWTR